MKEKKGKLGEVEKQMMLTLFKSMLGESSEFIRGYEKAIKDFVELMTSIKK